MIPCPRCSRFIRTNANGCPFCRVVLSEPSTMGPIVAGAILGLTLVACGGQESNDEGASGSTTFSEMEVSAYGGPTVDSVGESDPPPDEDSTSEEGGSTADGGSSSEGSGSSGSSTAGSDGTAGSGSSTGPQGTGSTTA